MILLLKSYPYHFVRTILSVPFCPIPFCLYTILSIPFCPYHFVRYHFVLEPYNLMLFLLSHVHDQLAHLETRIAFALANRHHYYRFEKLTSRHTCSKFSTTRLSSIMRFCARCFLFRRAVNDSLITIIITNYKNESHKQRSNNINFPNFKRCS